MSIAKKLSTDARLFLIHWLILALALLALGCAIGYSITHEYNRIDALEQERLTTQAKIVDANLERQLVALNMALTSICNDLPYWKAQKNSKALINRHLQNMSDAMPGVRTLIITDANGIISASNREQLIGLDSHEREYYQTGRQGLNPAMLYISPPFKSVLGVYVMNVTMVVLDAHGAFTGIVSAALDPDFISVLLNSVLYAPGMRASLIHGDGKIFVEIPNRKDLAGMDLAKPGSRYTLHVKSGRQANLFASGRAYSTGDERMSAWRTIRPASLLMDKPLMVSVNREMQGIFALWRRGAFRQGGLFGVMVLAGVFGLNFYQRRQQKFDRLAAGYMASLQKSEEKYRLLAENISDVIWILDLETMRFRYVSPSVERLRGYTAEEVMAEDSSKSVTPDSLRLIRQLVPQRLQKAVQGLEEVYVNEIEQPCKDGSTVWTEITTKYFKNQDNGRWEVYGVSRGIAERKQAEERLRESERRYRELSIIDGLTQLYNSRHFYQQLRTEIDRVNRYGQPLTLLLLDLDDFKQFNDNYGHVEGDQVLFRLGQVVKKWLRQTDSAYRYGGEEFTIILPMTTSEDGAVTAERIRTEFKKEIFTTAPDKDVHVTVSIGIAQYKTQEDMKAFVHRVDQLMYQGKKNGKDQVCSES